MDVAFMQQLSAHGFACATFEQHVVRHDDCGPAVYFQQCFDVLGEVELLVAGCRPEIVAHDGQRLPF